MEGAAAWGLAVFGVGSVEIPGFFKPSMIFHLQPPGGYLKRFFLGPPLENFLLFSFVFCLDKK